MKNNFVVVPMKNVREGEAFIAIEKQGAPHYDKRRRKWDKLWCKSREAFRMGGSPCHSFTEDGRDAIFSLTDWAVVRRDAPPESPRATVAGLLAKFSR